MKISFGKSNYTVVYVCSESIKEHAEYNVFCNGEKVARVALRSGFFCTVISCTVVDKKGFVLSMFMMMAWGETISTGWAYSLTKAVFAIHNSLLEVV